MSMMMMMMMMISAIYRFWSREGVGFHTLKRCHFMMAVVFVDRTLLREVRTTGRHDNIGGDSGGSF